MVRLRVIYIDVSELKAVPQPVVEDDYFAYCFDPRQRSPIEWASYLTYAVLADVLQPALAKALRPPSERAQEIRDVFYVAYQIVTPLGRRHFLHVYLRPEEPGATLKDLWDVWWPLHRRIGWEQIRHQLAAELEQIDLAYFQALLTSQIKRNIASGEVPCAEEIVCTFGHLLFPAIAYSHKPMDEVWLYKRLEHKIGEQWVRKLEALPENSDWEKHTVGTVTYLTEREKLSPCRDLPLVNHRRAQLIEQQLYLANQIIDAIKMQHQQEKRQQASDRLTTRALLNQLPWAERRKIRDAIISAPSSWQNVPIQGSKAWELMWPWRDAYEHLSERHRRLLLTLLSGDVHTLVSEYLELNPIKLLTHTGIPAGDDWDLNRCREAHRVYDDLIHGTRLPQIYCDTYKKQLLNPSGFITSMTKVLETATDLTVARIEGSNQEHSNQRDLLRTKAEQVTIVPEFFNHASRFFGFCVCLPAKSVNTLVEQAGQLCKEMSIPNGEVTFYLFRLPYMPEHESSFADYYGAVLFKNYLIFRYPGTWGFDSPPSNFKIFARSIAQTLEDVGQCFMGIHEGTWEVHLVDPQSDRLFQPVQPEDWFPSCTAQLERLISHIRTPAKIKERCIGLMTDINLAKNAIRLVNTDRYDRLLMLTFDGWYTFETAEPPR